MYHFSNKTVYYGHDCEVSTVMVTIIIIILIMVNEYEHVVVCSRSRFIASVARHGIIKGGVVAVGRVTRTRVIGATTVCRVRLPISNTVKKIYMTGPQIFLFSIR